MNILLIDVDSTIPNLALMKISAYHKLKEDEISIIKMPQNINLFQEKIDKVYASIIFSKNKHFANDLSFFYPSAEIIIGGSGYDLNIKLPDEIELLKPDYSLYPDINYSLGYTTRGCDRNCSFCIVPQKEGKFKKWHNPSMFHDKKFNKIIFLDNNILFDKEHFMKVCNFCIELSLKVWFTQGFDIRLVDDDIAEKLSKLKIFKGFHFAFDNTNLESIIKTKCELLKKVGIDIRHNVQFYVYLDSAEQYNDAVYRCRILKEIGTNPFVMFNINHESTKKINELRRWANRKQLFWTCDIKDYKR